MSPFLLFFKFNIKTFIQSIFFIVPHPLLNSPFPRNQTTLLSFLAKHDPRSTNVERMEERGERARKDTSKRSKAKRNLIKTYEKTSRSHCFDAIINSPLFFFLPQCLLTTERERERRRRRKEEEGEEERKQENQMNRLGDNLINISSMVPTRHCN